MGRFSLAILAVLALTLTLALALPTGAAARTNWVCEVPQPDGTTETVVFVSAADAALHGINTATGTRARRSTTNSVRSASSSVGNPSEARRCVPRASQRVRLLADED